jgi:hypothetical protein
MALGVVFVIMIVWRQASGFGLSSILGEIDLLSD